MKRTQNDFLSSNGFDDRKTMRTPRSRNGSHINGGTKAFGPMKETSPPLETSDFPIA